MNLADWQPSEGTVDAIERYHSNFILFCREALKIKPEEGVNLIPLEPRSVQLEWVEKNIRNPHTYVLKSRKRGLSTIIAAYKLWRALFTPNYRVILFAQSDDAVLEIFSIYDTFVDNLPAPLRHPNYPIVKRNNHLIEWLHGSRVKAQTTSSETPRGGTYQDIHCSEFAFYRDILKTIAAAGNIVGSTGTITLETTANGINYAHKLWFGDNDYEKIFISWKDDESCVSSERPLNIPSTIIELGKTYGLTTEQIWWATHTYRRQCFSDWNIFLQEHAVDPQTAFITSGRRFFSTIVFPHARAFEGYRHYLPGPQDDPKVPPFRAYTMGVDVATGQGAGDPHATTDYSAWCVLDVTNRSRPKIASTMYVRMRPDHFAALVLKELQRFNALVVVEVNGPGQFVQTYLQDEGWGLCYLRQSYNRVERRPETQLGFNTNMANRRWTLLVKLQQFVAEGWLIVIDERLKTEINTFVYDDKGKPQAMGTDHDDMIMATALALVGADQVQPDQALTKTKKPGNLREILDFERKTGLLFDKVRDELWPDNPLDDFPGPSPDDGYGLL